MLSRKWWIIIGVVVIALGLVLGIGLPKWLAPGVDLSSPTATVNSALDAWDDMNVGRMADCKYFEDPTYRDYFINDWSTAFEQHIESVEISDRAMEVTAQTETTATVEVSYHLKIVDKDGTVFRDDNVDEEWTLEKHDGNWLMA